MPKKLPKVEEIIVVEGRDDTAAIRSAVDAVTIETHGFGIRPEVWEMIDKAYRTKGIIVFTDPDTAGEQIRRRLLERFPEAKEAFLDQSRATKAGDIGIENASPESIREALDKAHGAVQRSDAAPTLRDTSSVESAARISNTACSASIGSTAASLRDASSVESAARISDTARSASTESTAASLRDTSSVESAARQFTPDDLFRWGLDGMPGAAQRRRALGQELGIGQATAKTFLQRLNRFGISREEIKAALERL